jgi:hypothetical protein
LSDTLKASWHPSSPVIPAKAGIQEELSDSDKCT